MREETGAGKMERRRQGSRQRDRHDGVTDRQRIRQRGREMRETEWGLQLQYVRVSLQDEAAKNINQFPQC